MSSKAICKLCRTHGSLPTYRGRIRAGSFGTMTDSVYTVMECSQCGVQYLDPFPDKVTEFYESEEYRQAYNEATDAMSFLENYDAEQVKRLERIGAGNLRDQVVGDFGCGGGSFLDLVYGMAEKTVAIEPFQNYHPSLRNRGHEVFAWGAEVPEGVLDLAVSFAVIEHVENPISFLKEIRASLKRGGTAYVVTPNRNEILMQINPDVYSSFYYRTAHLWYFSAESLTWVAHHAGFSDVKITYEHKYDLSNTLCWLRDERPTGSGHIDLFDERLNAQWRSFLEEKGWADNLWLEVRKA